MTKTVTKTVTQFPKHNSKYNHLPEYSHWLTMRREARQNGIPIHPHWNESFVSFLYAVGHKPSKSRSMRLNRINKNRGYFPGNVEWSTNTCNFTSEITITVGEHSITNSITGWAKELGVTRQCLHNRIRKFKGDFAKVLFYGDKKNVEAAKKLNGTKKLKKKK